MNADGTNQLRLTTNPGDDQYSVWSPDGSKIAFSSEKDGNQKIYVMNADGTNQIRLTYNAASDWVPDWSPDGRKIVFASNRDGNNEIYIMNADGSSQTRLTINPADDRDPVFSPDGSKIAFESDRDGNPEICVMNVDGTEVARLTYNSAVDRHPDWLSDKIVFTSNRDGSDEIYVMNSDGTGQTRLTFHEASDLDPAFSPDRTKIAFSSNRDGNYEIYVMNVDGSNLIRLTVSEGEDYRPDWKPTEFWVEVRGTGSTLTIRKTPGSQNKPESDVLERVPDGTRLQLVPDSNKVWTQKVDGDMWWHVKDVSDGTSGWAAGMYLFPIEDPFNSSFELNEKNLTDEEKDNQENYFAEKWAKEKKIGSAVIMGIMQKESAFEEAGNDEKESNRFVRGTRNQRGDAFYNDYLGTKEYRAFGYMQLWFSAAYDAGFGTKYMENAQQNIENPAIAKEYYDKFNNIYLKAFGKSLPVENNDYLAWFEGYYEWFKNWALDNRIISADKVEEKFFAYLDWPFGEWWGTDENIKYGTSCVLTLYNRYKNWAEYNDPLHNVISAYNWGIPSQKNIAYVRDIMTYYKLYYFGFKDRSDIIFKSPGELRVYDSQDRVTGLLNGEIREEIPNSWYDNETNSVTIIFPAESYLYEVFGTEEKTYGLEVSFLSDGKTIIFKATSIPISANATHRCTIDWAALSRGEEGVTVMVDSDSDGVFEHTFTSDRELNQSEYFRSFVDLNSDGIINILDIFIVAKAFGSKSGDPEWNAVADLNNDSTVNILDIFAVAWDYGKTI
jgi:hypothetical protein